jgi:hypothetical protein
MESESSFRVGFWFGLLLAKSMGFDALPQGIYDQLRNVARSELTLMPSPADALHDMEAHVGRPLTASEQALAMSSLPTNRAAQDAANRQRASLLLRLMGQDT